MPNSTAVSAALRRLADSIDAQPEIEMPQASLRFSTYDKDQFRAIVKRLPHPLVKRVAFPGQSYADLVVEHIADGLRVGAYIPQKTACRMVKPAQPAEYECDPILSPEEDAELTEATK